MSVSLWIAAAGAALLGEVWRAHRQIGQNLDPSASAKPLTSYPSVSVIRPIRGLDASAEENIRAALDPGYPGDVETLFVLDDETEPAVPIIRRAIAEARAAGNDVDARVLFCGRPPEGRTGKLNAMIVGLGHSRGQIVAFADSDIRPGPRALQALVETLLGDPQAGSAFAPTVAVEAPRTTGDVGYSLLLNGLYGPTFRYVAHRQGGRMPFIMGQFMAFKREAIDAIGGLETAEGQLVDDMYLGMRVAEEGYHNVVSPHSVPIIQHDLPLGEFLSTYVRWITFSRSGLPGRTFKLISWLRGAVFWLGLVLFAFALTQGAWLGAAAAALVPVATAASVNVLHRTEGGGPVRPQHLWVAFGLLASAPLIMLWILTHREVNWRGRRYALNASSRLAASSREPALGASVEAAPISSIVLRGAAAEELPLVSEPLSVSEPVSVSTSVAL